MTLRTDLQSTKGQMEGKEKDILSWLEQARTFQQQITERMAKKRKSTTGEASPPTAAEEPATAPDQKSDAEGTQAAESPQKEQKLKDEAKKLSEARFAAQIEAAKAKGKGNGNDATKAGVAAA